MRSFFRVANVLVGVGACAVSLCIAQSPGYLGDNYSVYAYLLVPIVVGPIVVVQIAMAVGTAVTAGGWSRRSLWNFLGPVLSTCGAAGLLLATWLGRINNPHGGTGC